MIYYDIKWQADVESKLIDLRSACHYTLRVCVCVLLNAVDIREILRGTDFWLLQYECSTRYFVYTTYELLIDYQKHTAADVLL